MSNHSRPKIIVIQGTTASGKSEAAIKLAQKFNGEVISADSRQVYRGMDIGTAKVPGKWNKKKNVYVSEGIPHHLIDIASPKTIFNAHKFQKKAALAIKDILSRKKLPIICGGTGFWIEHLMNPDKIAEVKPDPKLRAQLEKKSAPELFYELLKIDQNRAQTIDANNKVRLIRAIEIARYQKANPVRKVKSKDKIHYDYLLLGMTFDKFTLQERIAKRMNEWFRLGLIDEVVALHEEGLSWKRLESFGLEYKLVSQYLRGLITKQEMKERIVIEIGQYAKRQMTWFKRNSKIIWENHYSKIEKLVRNYLQKNPA